MRRRIALLATASLTVLAGGIALVAVPAAQAATGCRVTYTVQNQWPGGFTANLDVTNLGDPVTSWTLQWTFPDADQKVAQGWNGDFTQSGTAVTVTNMSWNGSLGTNGTVNPGFNGTHTGTNTNPTSFSLNGTACTGQVGGGTPTTPGTNPTTPGTTPTTPGTTPTTPGGNPGQRLDNPYAGARVYVNPEWVAKAATVSGGNRVASIPTGVWIDRIAAINGTPDSSSTISCPVMRS